MLSTSVAIGVVAFVGTHFGLVPVVFGLIGASLLFYGSVLLIFEARLAYSSVAAEMDFLWQVGKHYAPADLIEKHRPSRMTLKRNE